MGMFSSRAERERAANSKMQKWAQEALAKAQRRAVNFGLNTTGAVLIAEGHRGAASTFLLVFPDRVDLVTLGRYGSNVGKGAGVESIPFSRISSVQCRQGSVGSAEVMIFTSGNAIEFKTNFYVGNQIREAISGILNGSLTAAAPGAATTTPESPSAAAPAHASVGPLEPASPVSRLPKTPSIVTWAFVLSLCGVLCGVTAIAGLPLGIVGRLQAKKAGSGIGMATASIIISAGWLLLTAAVLIVGALNPQPQTGGAGVASSSAAPSSQSSPVTSVQPSASTEVSTEPKVARNGGITKLGFKRLNLMNKEIDKFMRAVNSSDAVAAAGMCNAMRNNYNSEYRLISSSVPRYDEMITGVGGILDNFYLGLQDCETAFGEGDLAVLADSIDEFQAAQTTLAYVVSSAKADN